MRVADGRHIVHHVDVGLGARVDEVVPPPALDLGRMRVVVLLHPGEGRVPALEQRIRVGTRSCEVRPEERRRVGAERTPGLVGARTHERRWPEAVHAGKLDGQGLGHPDRIPCCDRATARSGRRQPVEPEVDVRAGERPTRRQRG